MAVLVKIALLAIGDLRRPKHILEFHIRNDSIGFHQVLLTVTGDMLGLLRSIRTRGLISKIG